MSQLTLNSNEISDCFCFEVEIQCCYYSLQMILLLSSSHYSWFPSHISYKSIQKTFHKILTKNRMMLFLKIDHV